MAVTEMEQIEAEIAAIFSVRPARDCNVLDRLEVGKEMMSEVFLFAQYRGFALYDGLVVNFKMVWDDKEDGPPPLSCWLRLTKEESGTLCVSIIEDEKQPRQPSRSKDFDWARVI